jgi:DNA ligase-associated metallophosphoesterase
MPATIDITFPIAKADAPLRLFADGALYWPSGQTLFVTDPHFGKADSFRQAGIAIPTEVHDNDLARLTKVLETCDATRLVVLGDFFHNRHSQSLAVIEALEIWRSQWAELEIILVQGNHDLHAGDPPAHLNIQVVQAPWSLEPFLCHHQPQTKPDKAGYILAGHLHPFVVMRDRDGSRVRLPSYIFSPHQAILPAFGGFTGGQAYGPTAADRVFVIASGEIMEVPTIKPAPRGFSARR